ncbi:hypothetical protein R1sor_012147 [Riccia sorocarpa]|uniref:Uncharacterized protein n=1 Tax=Riccia sorocarpa TaxID=122646 RepID=A0ABD3I474_9MARC
MDSGGDSVKLVSGGGQETVIDPLWKKIDRAETCLVSSMFQEAIDSATSCLRELSKRVRDEAVWVSAEARRVANATEGTDEEFGELLDMAEASGMVLLQALHESGRSSETFEVLPSIFGSVSKVPYSLVLTGICLQISAGLHGSAKIALEEYLSGWKSSEDRTSGDFMTKLVPPIGHCQKRLCVLVTGLKNTKAAMLWMSQANIPEENKKAIFEQIQQIMQHERAKGKQKEQSSDNFFCDSTSGPVSSRSNQRKREQTNGVTHIQRLSVEPEEKEVEAAPKDELSPTAGTGSSNNSRAISKGSSICNKFPFVRTVCRLIELALLRIRAYFSPRCEGLGKRKKTVLSGAFISIILIALLRNRRQLFKFLASMANPVKSAFSDLWQQAFSVQLNPLAAAQPLPSARALVG